MENIIFTTTIPVLVNHLNYGNHLGYDSVLSIIQEARMRWLSQNDMGELSISNNIGYLITKVEVNYKAEAFHGDNLLIKLNINNLRKKSFELQYEIINQKNNSIVATAMTTHIFYDYANKKITSAPASFSNLIEAKLNAEV